jgi:hypothetical protein
MSEHEHKSEVKIFIDQHSYHSPTPTTGGTLYLLGKVEDGLFLYREVKGDHEDPEVPNGPEAVHLREDEHFHSGKPKEYKIYVNGQEKTITTKTVSYEQIVALAFPTPITGPNIIYTVGYEDGPHQNPMGSLMPGGKVYVKDGMIFDVTPTDKS